MRIAGSDRADFTAGRYDRTAPGLSETAKCHHDANVVQRFRDRFLDVVCMVDPFLDGTNAVFLEVGAHP
jgi:hypothetical protein